MAQHREAPAFQEYAASMMARTAHRVLSLEARGLLYTMRLECWVNGGLPSDPPTLARVLGFPTEQVERALPELGAFFSIEAGEFRCPELDDYRAHLDERKAKQSAGGRAGAAVTNAARGRSQPSRAAGKPRVRSGSLVKPSPVKPSKTQHLDGGDSPDAWVSDYERESRGF